MSTMIDLDRLWIGERVTMRYPNGMLQEAILVDNDAGILNFQFGRFICDCVGPVIDIFLVSIREGEGGMTGFVSPRGQTKIIVKGIGSAAEYAKLQ